MTAAELEALEADGATGDIGGQFFTQDGKALHCSYNQRVIGLTLEEMRSIPSLLAVAASRGKSKAILGARTRVINVLCIDDHTRRSAAPKRRNR
jgi:DNA-binding transcriptional regulator LsrR (DeoR family)